MIDDLLRRKYEHRFDLLDTDHDGYIEEADFTELGNRLLRGLGEPTTSAKGRAIRESKAYYWLSVKRIVGSDGRVSKEDFVNALAGARDPRLISDMVRPSIQADLALADRNDDGVVDIEEFTTLYQAIGIPGPDAQRNFHLLDRDGDGALTLDEWLTAAVEYFTSTDAAAPGNQILGKV